MDFLKDLAKDISKAIDETPCSMVAESMESLSGIGKLLGPTAKTLAMISKTFGDIDLFDGGSNNDSFKKVARMAVTMNQLPIPAEEAIGRLDRRNGFAPSEAVFRPVFEARMKRLDPLNPQPLPPVDLGRLNGRLNRLDPLNPQPLPPVDLGRLNRRLDRLDPLNPQPLPPVDLGRLNRLDPLNPQPLPPVDLGRLNRLDPLNPQPLPPVDLGKLNRLDPLNPQPLPPVDLGKLNRLDPLNPQPLPPVDLGKLNRLDPLNPQPLPPVDLGKLNRLDPLNPQPLPPVDLGKLNRLDPLNPQPLPPVDLGKLNRTEPLNPQPLPPIDLGKLNRGALNPQPLPPIDLFNDFGELMTGREMLVMMPNPTKDLLLSAVAEVPPEDEMGALAKKGQILDIARSKQQIDSASMATKIQAINSDRQNIASLAQLTSAKTSLMMSNIARNI